MTPEQLPMMGGKVKGKVGGEVKNLPIMTKSGKSYAGMLRDKLG